MQVFHVRGGRIRGQRGFVVEKVEDVTTADLVEHLLQQLYGDETARRPCRARCSCPRCRPTRGAPTAWLSELRGTPRRRARAAARRQARPDGDRDAQRRPGAGAAQDPARRRPHHAQPGARGARRRRSASPRRRCASSASTSATCRAPTSWPAWWSSRTAWPRKSRVPPVRDPRRRRRHRDDTRSIAEVVTRRFRRLLEERADPDDPNPGIDPVTGRPTKFAYPPQLFVVDGGQPQVEAAQAALSELGHHRRRASCGLAKRLEEVWLPGDPDPVILPRTSEGLYLLQRVRDEAHRFAIAYQRQKRGKRMVESILDDVPGLGEARKKALLRQFGSLKRLRAASRRGDRERCPGIGPDRRRRPSSTPSRRPRPAPGRQRDDGRDRRLSGVRRGAMRGARTRCTPCARLGHAPTLAVEDPVTEGALELVLVTRHVRGRAGRPRPGRWRTSAGSSSTTCRPRCCRRRSSRSRPTGRSRGSRSWSTSAAAACSTTSHERLERRRCADGRRPARASSSRPATTSSSAGSRAAGVRTRCRGRAGSSTASSASARCSATCAPAPTSSSTRRRSTSTTCAARSTRPSAAPSACAAGHGHVLRLQVRPAARRRHRQRRPLPAQPLLGAGAARAHRPRRRGERLRHRPAGGARVPRPDGRDARPRVRRLPARGQALRHRRDRLHRRQAPQRRDGREPRRAAGEGRASRSSSCTATWARE